MADNARIQERSLVINKIHKKYSQFGIVNLTLQKYNIIYKVLKTNKINISKLFHYKCKIMCLFYKYVKCKFIP